MTETRTTSSTGGQKGVKPQRHSLIPRPGLDVIAEVFGFGAEKYADHNWRKGYEWSKSYDALLRHLTAWWDGEDLDPESGLSHLGHAGFHILALATWEREGGRYEDFDDRYVRPFGEGWEELGYITEEGVAEDAGFKVTDEMNDALRSGTAPWKPFDVADIEPMQDVINRAISRMAEIAAVPISEAFKQNEIAVRRNPLYDDLAERAVIDWRDPKPRTLEFNADLPTIRVVCDLPRFTVDSLGVTNDFDNPVAGEIGEGWLYGGAEWREFLKKLEVSEDAERFVGPDLLPKRRPYHFTVEEDGTVKDRDGEVVELDWPPREWYNVATRWND